MKLSRFNTFSGYEFISNFSDFQLQLELDSEKERTETASNSIQIVCELKQQLRVSLHLKFNIVKIIDLRKDNQKLQEATYKELLAAKSDLATTKLLNDQLEKKRKAQIDQVQLCSHHYIVNNIT